VVGRLSSRPSALRADCRMTDAQNARANLNKLAPGPTDATREGVDAFSALIQKISSKATSASGTKKLLDAKARAHPDARAMGVVPTQYSSGARFTASATPKSAFPCAHTCTYTRRPHHRFSKLWLSF
jgi:hypothetical protein